MAMPNLSSIEKFFLYRMFLFHTPLYIGVEERFEEGQWRGAGDRAKLSKTEGQVWITLYRLLMGKDCQQRYEFTSARKNTILQVEQSTCLCVCFHACMFVCLFVQMCVCSFVSMHVCLHGMFMCFVCTADITSVCLRACSCVGTCLNHCWSRSPSWATSIATWSSWLSWTPLARTGTSY